MSVVLSLVAACGGDDTATSVSSGSADTSTASTSTTQPLTADSSETDPPETDPPATDPPATVPPATDPPPTAPPSTEASADEGACLIGDWVVTEQQMDSFYAGLMSTLEAPLTIDTTGSAPLSFNADGTYAWAPDFGLSVEVSGASGVGVAGGTITGNWTAVDGVVTTSSEVNALTLSISVNGVEFDGTDVANGLLNSSPVNGVTYSCDGPVLDFKTSDPAVTVPVTLTPA